MALFFFVSAGRFWPVRPSWACLAGPTGEAARQDGRKKLQQPKASAWLLHPLTLPRTSCLNGEGLWILSRLLVDAP